VIITPLEKLYQECYEQGEQIEQLNAMVRGQKKEIKRLTTQQEALLRACREARDFMDGDIIEPYNLWKLCNNAITMVEGGDND
jgi:uncharacterized coiled-coil protein SlyX